MTSRFNHPSIAGVVMLMAAWQITNAQWIPTGGPSGGMIMGMAVDENGTVFAASNSNGVFRSTDQGATWKPTDSVLQVGDVSGLTVVGNRITVYTLHDGKFGSIDEGAHWASTGTMTDNQVFSVVPGNDEEIYAQGYINLSRSTNGGASWKEIGRLADMGGSPMVVTADGTLLRGGETAGGLVRSTDQGATWSSPDTSLGIIRSFGKRNNGDIYASGAGVLYLSTDGGNNWARTGNVSSFLMFSINAILPDGNLFINSDKGIFRSADSGESWILASAGLAITPITTILAGVAGEIYAGTYGAGIFISNDSGATWSTPHSGLAITPVYTLAVNRHGEIIAGTFVAGIFRLSYSATNWGRLTAGLPDNCTVSDIVSNGADELLANTHSGLFRSEDGGGSWEMLKAVSSDDSEIVEMVYSGNGNIIIASESGLFCSTDNGSSWVAPNNGQMFPRIFSLAALGDSCVYAGTATGVLRSADGGIKWTSANTGLPGRGTVMEVSATPGGSLLATTSDDGLFRSIDNGDQWARVSNGQPESLFVYSIISDDRGNCFGYSGNNGVLLSTDDGTSWMRVDTGLPNTHILSLAASDGQLFAATNDCGVWRRPISEMTPIRRHDAPPPVSGPELLYGYGGAHSFTVSFTLAHPQTVSCSVYRLCGRRTAVIADNRFPPGKHRLEWHPEHANGVYLMITRIGSVCCKRSITIAR